MIHNIIKPYIEKIDLVEIARAEIEANKRAGKKAEIERVLKGETSVLEPEQTAHQGNAPDLKGFIHVPSIKLYVAKERSLNGLTWNQAVDKVYNQEIKVEGKRAEMPTPFEFMNYVKYLLAGRIPNLTETERQTILDDILKIGSYRGNWLNAKFVEHKGGFNNFGIEVLTFDSSGKLAKKTAPLEQCLWRDGWADINSRNNQGLLTKQYGSDYKQGKNVYFWYPRETNVARFDAVSDRASLNCYRLPDYWYSALGVRLVVRKKN